MNAQQRYDGLEESMSFIDPVIPFSDPANGRYVNISNPYLKKTAPISNPYSKSRNMGNRSGVNPSATFQKIKVVRNPYKSNHMPTGRLGYHGHGSAPLCRSSSS